MPLETSITASILEYLNNRVTGCVAEKVMGNSFQFGRPDINGCWNGRCLRIEVKQPGQNPTKKQQLNLAKWEKAGAICLVARSLNDVKKVINNGT